jgi:hypothetical protein
LIVASLKLISDRRALGDDTLRSIPTQLAIPTQLVVVRQGEVENRNHLPLPSAATDRHDLVGVVQIHAFDTDRGSENLSHKRGGQRVVRTRRTRGACR